MYIIRILHKCEVLIEKSVPKVTVWHHEALPSDAKLLPENFGVVPTKCFWSRCFVS